MKINHMGKIKCKNCGSLCSDRAKFFCSIACRNMFHSGEKSFTWTGGKPKCIDCKKLLARRNASRCQSCAAMGQRGSHWLGGITKLYISIRNCARYKKWRLDVYKKDNYTCCICGIKNGMGKTIVLNADHFPKKFSVILKEYKIQTLEDAIKCESLWNINNGRVLCFECHSFVDGFPINFRRP